MISLFVFVITPHYLINVNILHRINTGMFDYIMDHQLIRIDDLIKLSTRELRELDVRLRHILDDDTGLTDRDIAIILASLMNIREALDLRHMALR